MAKAHLMLPQINISQIKPNRWVSTPSTNCINRGDLSPHLDITRHITRLSLLSWLVCTAWRWPFSSSHVWQEVKFFWGRTSRILGKQTSIYQGSFEVCWLWFWGQNFDLWRAHLLAQISRTQISRSLGQFNQGRLQCWLQIWPQKLQQCTLSPLTRFDRTVLGWLWLSWKAKLDCQVEF